jgi:Ion channel
MNWSIHASFKPPEGDELTFPLYFYMSGTTLTTLGLGDVIPRSPVARLITVIEAGLGLGFVALVIAYLPVLYQAFSRREAEISLLDARAGSPPAAAELLRRSALRKASKNFCRIGSAGARRSWRAISLFRYSAISVRNIRTNP